MAAQAKYCLHIPKQGALPDIALAAHHYLSHGPVKTTGATIHRDVLASFNGQSAPHDLVTAYAEDTPESDSHMKQLGAYTGEMTNAPVIYVSKEGKNMAIWPIRNQLYQEASSLAPAPQGP